MSNTSNKPAKSTFAITLRDPETLDIHAIIVKAHGPEQARYVAFGVLAENSAENFSILSIAKVCAKNVIPFK
jgi:cyclophilin family peptidyl-prolyl cis-trans isomerase